MTAALPPSFELLHVPVHATSLDSATALLEEVAAQRKAGYVIFRDVHGIVRCNQDPGLLSAHREAMLVCPDGMPLVKEGKRLGHSGIGRTYGPDTMRSVMSATVKSGHRHFLYGGVEGVAEQLKEKLEAEFPGVQIVGTQTPPFTEIDQEEREKLRSRLEECQPHYFWVGLSTPKQEMFMQKNSKHLPPMIMLGVGAAFDYLSGRVKESPLWIRKCGLQWIHRALQEPRRLGTRYAVIVPRYLWLRFREK